MIEQMNKSVKLLAVTWLIITDLVTNWAYKYKDHRLSTNFKCHDILWNWVLHSFTTFISHITVTFVNPCMYSLWGLCVRLLEACFCSVWTMCLRPLKTTHYVVFNFLIRWLLSTLWMGVASLHCECLQKEIKVILQYILLYIVLQCFRINSKNVQSSQSANVFKVCT